MKALLIVDVQNDFLSGTLPVPRAKEIIDSINSIQPYFKTIIATKDWHPLSHISFASTHHVDPFQTIEINGRNQELWPDHCVMYTKGAEFPKELHQERISHVIFKGSQPFIDSYSAFFDNAKQKSTGLKEYLKTNRIQQIYLCGLSIEYCLLHTALDAIAEGFTVNLLLDACRGIEAQEGDIEKAMQKMRKAKVQFITTHELTLLASKL